MYFKLLVHRLSRHAIMYKGDLRTSSTAVLDRPMSASRWSSSSRSCPHWYRRSHPRAIPASHANGIFQDHLRAGSDGDATSRVLVELQIVLPHDMFHLRKGAKQRLAAGAHRAVVTGPSVFCITPTFGAQATVNGQAELSAHRGKGIAVARALRECPIREVNRIDIYAISVRRVFPGDYRDDPVRRQPNIASMPSTKRWTPCRHQPKYR
jgi:hypothetical protein